MEILQSPGNIRSILFVGEGNFSFSRSLIDLWSNPNYKVTATCYESEPTSDQAKSNIETLVENGVSVEMEYDATKIENTDGLMFDLIIFMFPHIGGKMKIGKNRTLLKNFATSVEKVTHEHSRVIVSLCDGQGGTEFDVKKRKEADSWQIVKMMSYGHFGLIAVDGFDQHQFQDYRSFGYRSLNKGFHTEQGKNHVFCKKLPLQSDMFLCVPTYENDLSFWLPKPLKVLKITTVEDLIKEMNEGAVKTISLIDSYYDSKKDIHSQTIRLYYHSNKIIRSPKEIMDLHYKIGHKLHDKLGITVR